MNGRLRDVSRLLPTGRLPILLICSSIKNRWPTARLRA